MFRFAIVVVCLASLATPRSVQALSIACWSPEEHFFFECHERVCLPLFRAAPLRENACEWQLVIEPVQQWVADALVATAERRGIETNGVLHSSVPCRSRSRASRGSKCLATLSTDAKAQPRMRGPSWPVWGACCCASAPRVAVVRRGFRERARVATSGSIGRSRAGRTPSESSRAASLSRSPETSTIAPSTKF